MEETTREEQVKSLISLKDQRQQEIQKLHKELVECKRLSAIRRRAVESLIAVGKFKLEDWNAALKYVGEVYINK